MEKIEKDIEFLKDNFIIYCVNKYKNDPTLNTMLEDIKYFEERRSLMIDCKRFKEDRTTFINKLKNIN